ncbi:hypothetical protein D3C84_840900 [compost metagenome]
MPINSSPGAQAILKLLPPTLRIKLMQRKNIQKQRGIPQRHHVVHMPELLLHQRQILIRRTKIHRGHRIARIRFLIVTQLLRLPGHPVRRQQTVLSTTVTHTLPRLMLFTDQFDAVRRVKQPAAHLLGGKRRQPGPLKPGIVQPESSVRSVDNAVALDRVGNQYPSRCDDVLRLPLVVSP